MKETIHKQGSKLMMTAKRFFFNRNTQAKIEPRTTATGYREITKTKVVLYALKPLSKLINERPQMTNQGNKEIRYNI